jgi:hypothetical protein
MEKPFGQLVKELGTLVFILVLAYIVLDKTTNIFVSTRPGQISSGGKVVDINIPDYNSTGGLDNPKVLDILEKEKTYIPSVDVFTKNYKKEAKRIALSGKFITADFVIEGKTNNKKDNVLSVNLGNISGIYGISRLKSKGVVISDDKAIFNNEKPLNIDIDLMAQTRLSATLKELNNGITSGYKDLYLWQHIEPPPESGTVMEFLFVPFAQDGVIGETTITKLEFQYRCEEEGKCNVALCDSTESNTQCLQKKIGAEAAQNYGMYFKKVK